jgi:flagellar hook assembly protein FlgD
MYPNPFRPDGAKRARVLPEGLANDAQLTIYDANGRHLRSLSLLEAEAGWDGRDAHGEFVPSGVYLLLITSSGGSAEGKIAVIR